MTNGATLKNVQLVSLARHSRPDGTLVVIEQGKELPFAPARIFTVEGGVGAVRGQHAHKRCSQLMVCTHGKIEVKCDDGVAKSAHLLDRADIGILVPPLIWSTEIYHTEGAVLMVVCDRLYEQDDYLRTYEEFLTWRKIR